MDSHSQIHHKAIKPIDSLEDELTKLEDEATKLNPVTCISAEDILYLVETFETERDDLQDRIKELENNKLILRNKIFCLQQKELEYSQQITKLAHARVKNKEQLLSMPRITYTKTNDDEDDDGDNDSKEISTSMTHSKRSTHYSKASIGSGMPITPPMGATKAPPLFATTAVTAFPATGAATTTKTKRIPSFLEPDGPAMASTPPMQAVSPFAGETVHPALRAAHRGRGGVNNGLPMGSFSATVRKGSYNAKSPLGTYGQVHSHPMIGNNTTSNSNASRGHGGKGLNSRSLNSLHHMPPGMHALNIGMKNDNIYGGIDNLPKTLYPGTTMSISPRNTSSIFSNGNGNSTHINFGRMTREHHVMPSSMFEFKDWKFEAKNAPMANEKQLTQISNAIGLKHLPEMVFSQSYLKIKYKENIEIVWNAVDGLKPCVGMYFVLGGLDLLKKVDWQA